MERGRDTAFGRQASGVPHSWSEKPSPFRRRSCHCPLVVDTRNAMRVVEGFADRVVRA